MQNQLLIQGELAIVTFDIRLIEQILIIRRCFCQQQFLCAACDDWDTSTVKLLNPYLFGPRLQSREFPTQLEADLAIDEILGHFQAIANIGPFGLAHHPSIITITATPEWVAQHFHYPHSPAQPKTPDTETAETAGDKQQTIGAAPANKDGAILSIIDGGGSL